jgi:hypothetical protein
MYSMYNESDITYFAYYYYSLLQAAISVSVKGSFMTVQILTSYTESVFCASC